MRRGNGSLYLTASLCCAVAISAATCLLIPRAAPAATPQNRHFFPPHIVLEIMRYQQMFLYYNY